MGKAVSSKPQNWLSMRRTPYDLPSCERGQVVVWKGTDNPPSFETGNYNVELTRATWRGMTFLGETRSYKEQSVKRLSLKGTVGM